MCIYRFLEYPHFIGPTDITSVDRVGLLYQGVVFQSTWAMPVMVFDQRLGENQSEAPHASRAWFGALFVCSSCAQLMGAQSGIYMFGSTYGPKSS